MQQMTAAFVPAVSGPPSVNLVENLDASTLTGSDGTDITTWVATTGKNATGTVLLTGKVFNAVKNGLNIIRFDGIAATMATSSFDAPLTQTFCTFFVFKLSDSSNLQRMFSDIVEAGGNRCIFRNNTTPAFDIYAGSGFQPLDDSSNSWYIISVEWNGASTKFRLNGGTEDTIGGSPGTFGFTGLRISGDYDGTINPAAMDVGQILMYSGAIADKTAYFNYLNTKWNVY